MSKHCLIIIDPQKDFTSRSGAYARRHNGISQIEDALNKIRQLVTKQKNQEIIIIYSDYSEGQFGDLLNMCIPGTEGHRIDIRPDQPFQSFSKTVHSAFSSPAFSSYLESRGFEHLYLCGFLAEYCVLQTGKDGLANGYSITLLQDCIGTGDDVQERKSRMIMELQQKGALVENSVVCLSF